MSRIIRRPSADDDLIASYRYLARRAGLAPADRFLVQAEATFARLTGLPRLGTPYEPDERLFADLRYTSVTRFRDHLVFYRPIPDGIEVFRVLNGARDITGIIAEEFNTIDDTES